MIKRLLIAVAISCALSDAQVPVTPIVQPHMTFVNEFGLPCVLCTLSTFAAGTNTPLATFVDAAGTSQNTNPIILGADGGPPSGIWLSGASYKLVLKDALGTTIWTVDQVKGGGGLGGICGPANAIQIANSSVNGLTCDATITINTASHTLNVGTLPSAHVTIGALGMPTSWTFDTTSPATALASLGGGVVGTGSAGQIVVYTSPTAVQGASAIPSAIIATTQTPGDNSGKLATTAYVAIPGAIKPTSVQIAAGVAVTGNQGNGLLLQHSTGATTTNDCVKFDANGNTIDAGFTCSAATPRTCNANGCYLVLSDGTILQWGSVAGCSTADNAGCTAAVTFPTSFTTTTNLSVHVSCIDGPANCLSNVSGSPSTSGFTGQLASVVYVGGGGGHLSGSESLNWMAIGN